MDWPTLRTARLVLRALTSADAPRLQELANAREVALNTLRIPHPYTLAVAQGWIAAQPKMLEDGEINLAIDDGQLAGMIGLTMTRQDDAAEIGYWIAVPCWGRGYATEAAQEMVRYGFEELQLNKIFAGVFKRNPSSARVLQKLGMRHEGTHRQQHKKWDEYVDTEFYGILKSEWRGQARAPVLHS